MAAVPFVSVIVPCRNEARYIAECLTSILDTDHPAGRLEVLVADGRSDDGTREVIERVAREHPAVRLIDNRRRITPAALNAAIRQARGDVIVRMDAHVVYPRDYITRLVCALEETGADNVGGVIETLPEQGTPVARAIALGLSHPLGVGNSWFRIGARERRWVDTVPFGCYRREVFARIGLFDEELARNQDEELNFRLLRAGGRILLVPDVVARYYARGSLRKVGRMYYQYGYFKPIVARKIGRVMTARQVVPAAFVLALATAALLAPWLVAARVLGAAVALCYAAAVLGAAARAAPRHGLRCALALAAVFPTLHVSYGIGSLRSIAEWMAGAGTPAGHADTIPLSR